MCAHETSDIERAITTAVQATRPPLTTQSIGDLLAAQGVCRYHAREALRAVHRTGAICTKDPFDKALAIPAALWTGPAPASLGEVEILDPHRFGIPLPQITLGRGGNGIVVKGIQLSIDRPCAIKFLAPELMKTAQGETVEAKRLHREIALLAQLSHPNIITVLDGGTASNGTPYLAMELMEWPTLHKLVMDRGVIPPLLVAKFIRAAASGLHYAYNRVKIYHRDIKPANIFVDVELGTVKVADFGLACLDEASLEVPSTETSISRGMPPGLLGTPAFQAPERYRFAKGNQQSDLYSLGITAYWSLTGGRSPFPNLTADSTIAEWFHAHDHIDTMGLDLKAACPQCPDHLAQIVRRMIRREPKERPQSYPELIRDLDRVIRDIEPRTTFLKPTVITPTPISPGQQAGPHPSAPASSSISHLLNKLSPPTPPSPATTADSSVLRPPVPHFVPEDLRTLSDQMEALEDRYKAHYNSNALYLAGPLLIALAERAQKTGDIEVLKTIWEMDTGHSISTADFILGYRELVSGKDLSKLPKGTPDLPVSPTRYFYDSHAIALHSSDGQEAKRAQTLAERVLGFLSEAIEAPEFIVLRTQKDGSPAAPSKAPPNLAPAPTPTAGSSQTMTKILRINARVEAVEKISMEFAQAQNDWFTAYGHACFRLGPIRFRAALWDLVKASGLTPVLDALLVRTGGKAAGSFVDTYERILLLDSQRVPIEEECRLSGVALDLTTYAQKDYQASYDEARQDREANAPVMRAILAFLRATLGHPALEEFRVKSTWPAPGVPSGTQVIPPAAAGDPFAPNSTIGTLKLLRVLGQGGMGTVYLAHDADLDRQVAVKVLNPSTDPVQEEENQRLFNRELKLAASLRHPNIVQVHSTFMHAGRRCLVMELVDGTSLTNALRSVNRFDPDRALKIVRQVAGGLSHAHKKDLVHRDIKPDNILVDVADRAVIVDFGLTKSVRVKMAQGDGGKTTTPGTFLGTPHYASPEQASAFPVDQRSDIYSLGATLYELLSGARPFTASTQMSLLVKIADLKTLPDPLSKFVPGIDPEIEVLVDRMMAKKVEERFLSCDDVVIAIDRILEKLEAQARRRHAPGRGKLLVGAMFALVLAALLAYYYWPPTKTQSPVAKGPFLLPPTEPEKVPAKVDPPTESTPPRRTPEPPKEPAKEPPKPPPPLPDKIPDIRVPKAGDVPVSPAKEETSQYILTNHAPSKEEIALLDELLQLGRASLPSRSAYEIQEALAKTVAFREAHSKAMTPWLSILTAAERERLESGHRAFRARPLFAPAAEQTLALRNNVTLQGRILSQQDGILTFETLGGARRDIPIAEVAPVSFPQANAASLEALLARSAAGDARGVLEKTSSLDEADRQRFLPFLLDQSIEEVLLAVSLRADVRPLLGFKIPEAHRASAERLIPARVRLLETEQDAAKLYERRASDPKALARLLSELPSTRVGVRASQEVLTAFNKSIPPDSESEVGRWDGWGYWKEDTRNAKGGGITASRESDVYLLSAPEAGAWVWIWKNHEGAKKGYRLQWTFKATTPETARFWVALSQRRRLEIGRKDTLLYRLENEGGEDKPVLGRKVDHPSPVENGVLTVIPKGTQVLVFMNDRLLLALDEKTDPLEGRIQLGASGGALSIESIRVVDRNAK